ncbi:Protein tyrosine kinase/Protein kinase domain containing protein, putative [Leishmania lindenbergi]|uniref:non-specific serine/threonine protein kinase n=1 Tax=Leishmania lindenbergi TaxID=651832 RepID=A0AAW3AMK0_9TRYP
MMLPPSAPSWDPGPPDPALYSTTSSHDDTPECGDTPTSPSCLHIVRTTPPGLSAEDGTASPTPASMEMSKRETHHSQCSTAQPLKPLTAELSLASVAEVPRCTLAGVTMQSSGDLPHSSMDGGGVSSALIRATPTAPLAQVDGPLRLPLFTNPSSVRLRLDVMLQVSSGNAISDQARTSASSTSSNRREVSRTWQQSPLTFVSQLPSDSCIRASSLAGFCVQHVKAHGRNEVPFPAPPSVHPALSTTNSAGVVSVLSDTHFDRSVDDACGAVESNFIGAAAASCTVVHATPSAFGAPPRPSTALSSSLAGVGGAPSLNSSNPSTSVSALKDRHSSGTGMDWVPSKSSSLQPFRASLLDSDDVGAEDFGSEVSGTEVTSVRVEVSHRRCDSAVTGGRCSRLASGRSVSTPVSGALGGFAPDVSGTSAGGTTASVAAVRPAGTGSGGGAEVQATGCPFSWRMFSSLTSQRGSGDGGAPASSLGIFQSGLFLSMDESDALPASVMDVPMTPQSFSTMLLARESGEGVPYTFRTSSAASVATTNGARFSPFPPPVPESSDTLLGLSSQQATILSGAAEEVWCRDGVIVKRTEEWCVDGGDRDSHGACTRSTTVTSGFGQRPSLVTDSGSAGLVLGGHYMTPLSSFHLATGSSQPEMPMSGVNVDEIPSTPTDLTALPHPPPLFSAHHRRQRQGGLHRNCGGGVGSSSSRVDWETGVIETDRLERARAVSQDSARTYEIVNEKYVMYDYELGKGSYSTVQLSYNLVDGHFYAVKVLDCARLKRRQLGSEASLCKIDQEITMMKQMQHRNIIALHEVIRDPSMRYVYLVLELAESREVLSMRDNGDVLPRGENAASKAYPEDTTREIVKGLLQALMYAHYLGVAHRDIKPSNVLRTADGTVKLCDFGVSVLAGEVAMQLNREGSVAFLAPELLLSREADVSRSVTPPDSSLSTTQNRSALHILGDDTLASTARTACITVTSTTTTTSATQLASSVRQASPTEEAATSAPCLTAVFADATLQPSPRATSSRSPQREMASLSGDTSSSIPPQASSVSLPQRDARGDGGAPHRASFRTSSLSPRGTAAPAHGAADVMASATPCSGNVSAASPLTGTSWTSTPAVQQLGYPLIAVDHTPVDLFKADVFALGVTVYTMLLGQLPWRASSAESQRTAILAEPDPFLRLYKAAYGDAYTWPAKIREACMPCCDMIAGDAFPVTSPATMLASNNDGRSASHGNASSERSVEPRVCAAEKGNGAAPSRTTSLPCKWTQWSSTGASQDECTSGPERCALTATKLVAAPHFYCDATTRRDPNSVNHVAECSSKTAVLSCPTSHLLATKATAGSSRALSDLAQARSDDDDSRVDFAASLPPMPPLLLQPPQWKSFVDVSLGSVPIKKATAADTSTTEQAQMTVTHRRGGDSERVEGDLRDMNSTRACVTSSTSASTLLPSQSATQTRLGAVMKASNAHSTCAGEYAAWQSWGAALKGTEDPPPLRPPRPTTTPDQLNMRHHVLKADNGDWTETDVPDAVNSVRESTMEARQWMRRSSSDLLSTVLSTVVSTTVSCSAAISATSSLSSDDEEDLESCESIYERLFELEQPCRPYKVVEHMPLPIVPGASREISGDAVDFVRSCLHLDPTERRTVFELFRHPWIRGEEKAGVAELSTSLKLPRRSSSVDENGGDGESSFSP